MWAVLAALAVALAGLVLAGDRVGARVLRSFPPQGGALSAYGRVGVEFAQAMQAESVAAHFTVEPAVGGAWHWVGHTAWFAPNQALVPGTTYTARLAPGAASTNGRVTRAEVAWTFTVREPRLGYLAPASGGPTEVWRAAANAPGAAAVTATGGRVFDFALSPDGEQIVLSVVNTEGGIDLWLQPGGGMGETGRMLVNCGFDRCSAPAWSPTSAQLAYSREEQGLSPNAPHGPPRVWLANPDTGATSALFQDSQVLGYGPTWSPDGQRLAFFDGSVNGIRVLDLPTGATYVLPTFTGLVGAFAPDSATLLFTDLTIQNNETRSHLYAADLRTGAVNERSGPPGSDYGPPAWSPDGQWIAIGVRAESGGPGRQLWLMRPDGSEAHALLQDPAYTYGRYQWDPYSQRLAVQRLPLGTPFPKSEVVVVDIAGASEQLIAVDATLPTWWP